MSTSRTEARTGTTQSGGLRMRTLRVDWPACKGRGVCAEVLPELIALDEWGYPIVGGPVPDDLRDLAVEAVAACPHAALRLLTARA